GAAERGAPRGSVDSFSSCTTLLARTVRERPLLSVEQAVHLLCDVPARLYGLRDRGRIREGWHADLVLFDLDRVGPGPLQTRYDLPAGAGRLYGAAEGIERVCVGGTEVVDGGEFTGEAPGTLLRSGRDTDTVTAR